MRKIMLKIKDIFLLLLTGFALVMHVSSMGGIISAKPCGFIIYIATAFWLWAFCKANHWFEGK